MGSNKSQGKEVSEKPVGTDHSAAPSKVGSEAVNSPEYANLAAKEYASFGPLNIEMEKNGTLPKFSLNLDQQTKENLQQVQEAAMKTGEGISRGFQDMVKAADQAIHHDYGKDIQQRLAELASELDANIGKLIHGNAGDKPQPNMPHGELEVIQDLKDRPMNSFNCHYLVKTHIEGAPPNESTAKARNEQVTPNYLQEHGYNEVKDGKDAKPGDIIVVEDTGADRKGHYYNHAAIVSGTDGKGHVTETLQKLNPDAPVSTLNAAQFKGVYAPDGRYKIHIYRNPAKEGHLE
jgi:hypothetical protein